MTPDNVDSNNVTAHTPANGAPHLLLLGNIAATRLLGGSDTGGQLALVALEGLPGSGPGPHLDPWRESFYVLEGELTFRVEEHGAVRTIVARRGDAVTIPQGVGHAFSVTGHERARYLIASSPAGIAAFFADAGVPIDGASVPANPPPSDRERLQAAFTKHGLRPYRFPAGAAEPG